MDRSERIVLDAALQRRGEGRSPLVAGVQIRRNGGRLPEAETKTGEGEKEDQDGGIKKKGERKERR